MVERSFGKQNLMRDDPLEFILSMLGYKHRKYLHVVQVFIFIIVSYLQIFSCICLTDIIFNKNFDYLEYLPGVLIIQPGCLGMVMVAICSKDVFQFQEFFFSNFWSISSGGEKIKNKILQESKIIKLVCILIYGLSLVAHFCLIPIDSDEKHFYFPIMYCMKHFGRWSNLPISMFYLCLLLIAYGIVYAALIASYICFHVRFQFQLLSVEIRNLPKEDLLATTRFNDRLKYQSGIYESLSACAKRHADIKTVTNILIRKLQNGPVLIVGICAVLAFVSTSYVLIYQIGPLPNWKMILALATASLVFLIFCVSGQKISDGSNQFFLTLCQTPWYHWNKRSNMVLGMMLTNSLEPLVPTCFGFFALNYSLILLVVRTIYNLLAVCSNFK